MSKLLEQIIITELEDLADRIAANIIKTEQADIGATRKSMHVENESNVFALYSRGGLFNLEIGSHHRPPFSRIYSWVQRKITADPKEARGVTYAILHKHETEGSFLRRNGRTFNGVANPDVYSTEIKKTVERLYEKLGAYAIRQLETITLNF